MAYATASGISDLPDWIGESSLPSAEDVRLNSAEEQREFRDYSQPQRSKCRKCICCSFFSIVFVGILIGLTIGLSGKSPDELVEEAKELVDELPFVSDAGADQVPSDDPFAYEEMDISSPTGFENGGTIPQQYTADGDDKSPPLTWFGAPDSTQSLVLIVDDPKVAGDEPWTHWIVYNIPPGTNGIPEGAGATDPAGEAANDLVQGLNTFVERKVDGAVRGYMGPDPPAGSGDHTYYFRIFALNGTIDLDPAEATRGAVDDAMGRLTVVGKGEMTGTYGRD